MAKSTFSHRRRILGTQPARVKSLYPGMFTNFRYKGKNLSDDNPLIMVLWNDYSEYKIHGINLNYLQESKIKYMFQYHIEININHQYHSILFFYPLKHYLMQKQ